MSFLLNTNVKYRYNLKPVNGLSYAIETFIKWTIT